MAERILAIDPGERVGWAHGVADVTRLSGGGEPIHDLEITGQGVSPLKDFALKLGESIGNYDTVIYETWRLYPEMGKKMTGNDMQPAQLVGMIRYLAWTHPQVKLVSQGAAIKNTALKTMPEEISKRFKKSSEQHDKDALMHLWFYFWDRYA
jgi:hypothetical protein